MLRSTSRIKLAVAPHKSWIIIMKNANYFVDQNFLMRKRENDGVQNLQNTSNIKNLWTLAGIGVNLHRK